MQSVQSTLVEGDVRHDRARSMSSPVCLFVASHVRHAPRLLLTWMVRSPGMSNVAIVFSQTKQFSLNRCDYSRRACNRRGFSGKNSASSFRTKRRAIDMETTLVDAEDGPISEEAAAPAALNEDSTSRELYRKLHRSHTLRLQNPPPARPLPHLDVLSLQSRRLVSQTREQIAVHEASNLKQYPRRKQIPNASDAASETSEAEKLEDLLQSVHLLLEPIHIPDLSHTGVFDPSISLLQPAMTSSATSALAAESTSKLSLANIEKDDEIKLFYPTGAKKSNMREYIKETIQRHLASESTQSVAELPHAATSFQAGSDGSEVLRSSTSVPVIASQLSSPNSSSSPPRSVTKSGAKSTKKPHKTTALSPSPIKHKRNKALGSSSFSHKSPTSSACGSPLVNPELTRQAKDIIAAIRANSSKINDLMNS